MSYKNFPFGNIWYFAAVVAAKYFYKCCHGLAGADKPCHWLLLLCYWCDWDQQKEPKQPQVSWSRISTSSCSSLWWHSSTCLWRTSWHQWRRFLQCFRRWRTRCGSWRWCSTSFFPKIAKWSSSRSQLVKVLCRATGIQIEGKEPPLWQCSHHFLP